MKARKDMVRMGTKVGGVFGAIAFLAVGLIPGFYFGSYGTLVLLNHLFGGPLEATVLVRAAIAVGIIMGIACVASVLPDRVSTSTLPIHASCHVSAQYET